MYFFQMKSQLEIFPNELLLELFSYLSPTEIYQTWSGLNGRFQSIFQSVQMSLVLLENAGESIRILNEFSSQIIFIHLRVSIPNLDFQKFLNLRSLIIDAKLTDEQIQTIKSQFLPSLRRLTLTEEGKQDKSFDEMVFHPKLSSAWIQVYHLPSISKCFLHKSSNISHIQTMIFDRLTSNDVHLILTFLPNLRRLKVTVVPSISDEILFSDVNYQHRNLIDFHAKMNTHNKLDELYPLLSHLPSLRYLSVIGDSLMINDFEQLALQLHTRVPQLQRLNCSFKQTRIENINRLHRMSPLFHRMKCREIQWIGTGWYYYCITTEHF